MLTKEQEKWLEHLNDNDKIEILPYNPEAEMVFTEIEKEIKSFLPEAQVLHCGSTALKILGQREVDSYVPISEKEFNNYLAKLIGNFGQAGSIYALRRARFVKHYGNIKVEIFLINQETDDWKNLKKFENYLKENNDALQEYSKIKQESNGLSTREYYREKLEFINKILDKNI